jgi:hypothetical protein
MTQTEPLPRLTQVKDLLLLPFLSNRRQGTPGQKAGMQARAISPEPGSDQLLIFAECAKLSSPRGTATGRRGVRDSDEVQVAGWPGAENLPRGGTQSPALELHDSAGAWKVTAAHLTITGFVLTIPSAVICRLPSWRNRMELLTAELRGRLPALYSQEHDQDPTVHCKF